MIIWELGGGLSKEQRAQREREKKKNQQTLGCSGRTFYYICTVVQTDKTNLGEGMFPRARDGAQLVGSLPGIACTRPWLPLQHQYGVQVCNPALRRCRQEGSQTQGPPRLAWATRDPVLWGRGGQRESISGKARQYPTLSWHTGEGGHSHPILHRASPSSSLSSTP